MLPINVEKQRKKNPQREEREEEISKKNSTMSATPQVY
jgi:hypothetical protein